MRRKLAAGNWKMNGTRAALGTLEALSRAHTTPSVDILICPPATLLAAAVEAVAAFPLAIGGQDCHAETSGAHTGDISAEMLHDAGASAVILGHSERREAYGETSETVRAKAKAAQATGLMTLICVGESLAQREAENTLDIIGAQLALSVPDTSTAQNCVIAYEPCWAIGTGLTPTPEQIAEVHGFMRTTLAARFADADGMRLLYGGSVKPANAAEIFGIGDVDGALVGGGSLTPRDFSPIINALESAL
ncbi:triose-phosphate isomerase [Roseovarius sp. LXJ103]|uniref:triose-phosphate isomerase n=1 Tax=Roseovarius carneus TaxID=2853164 RepID=UPI000D60EF44|nr:triose-phosphate isomerase [Roseovarius carneus]MBZ8119339.1 triose-phosphate isomerase [Roseovarius carneus]PWE35051.1 triose-phosphate isomerase [Pelagicola sp. LXJ1103]